MRPSFFHHLHPPTIPAAQARFRYTLGAGGLAVFLVVALVVTGILLMFFYVPTPERAAQSIQAVTYLAPLGGLVRNLHYWAGQALVVVVVVHLLRVIFTGAYLPPRRFNYLLGLVLLVLTLFLDFSGYVLRWDEGVRWALVAGTNLLKTAPAAGDWLYGFVVGGTEPGPATILRFYAWHIFGLTLPLVVVGGWHLFRVRRDGGIAVAPPEARADSDRTTRFDLVRREALAALLASAALLLLSTFFAAPIAQPMNTANSVNADSRAPWFFLWVQLLLRLGDPFLFGVVIPTLVLIVLILIPYLFPRLPAEQLGRWFPPGGRGAQIMAALLVLLWVSLTWLALT